jgi:hypothetical protein
MPETTKDTFKTETSRYGDWASKCRELTEQTERGRKRLCKECMVELTDRQRTYCSHDCQLRSMKRHNLWSINEMKRQRAGVKKLTVTCACELSGNIG